MKPMNALGSRHIHRHRGAILLGVLVLLMIAGMAVANYSQSWWAARQRALEQELLFDGLAYQRAIESYYLATPGPVKALPVSLNDLVNDNRYPQPVHHLRKLYPDPLNPSRPWGLIKQGGAILGVYSQADGEPFKQANFDPPLEGLAGAKSYADWRFIYIPRGAVPAAPPAAPAPATPTNTNNRVSS